MRVSAQMCLAAVVLASLSGVVHAGGILAITSNPEPGSMIVWGGLVAAGAAYAYFRRRKA